MAHATSAGILATLLVVSALPSQSPIPVYREPRHRLVWDEGAVRVLDVQIAPGDTTLFHVHDTPMLSVRIAVSPVDVQGLGGGWSGVGPTDRTHFYPGAIDADTTYRLQPITHRVTNAGTTAFHLIGILNGGPGIAAGRRSAPVDLPGTSEHLSSWFQALRFKVPLDAGTRWFLATTPVIVVQPGHGRFRVERQAGTSSPLGGPGAWVVIAVGTHFRIHNDGSAPAELVLVAVR